MIDRNQAIVLIRKYLKDEDLIKHSIATEAILKKIARILGKDEDLWSLTGLLHNLDYEYTSGETEKRGIVTAQLLEGLLPENCVNAIKATNYMHSDYVPSTSLDKSLIATVAIADFILAVARSTPSKNLSEININTLVTKLNDPAFTDKYVRSRILLCTDVGIDLKDFLQLSLNTLKEAPDKL